MNAGFAAHFVLAQLLPQYLNAYDALLADQLRGVDLSDAREGATLGEGLATSLLQERSALMGPLLSVEQGERTFLLHSSQMMRERLP